MGLWTVAAPILGSVIGGLMSRKRPTEGPQLSSTDKWTEQYGPGMLQQLRGQATGLMDSPYGLGDVKQRLQTTARDTATASYASQQSEIDRQAKLSGLDPSGGSADRQRYYAGGQMAEGLNKAYTGIELQDFMAKEEQRNRGLNLMLAISKSNPALSQIASHNYWNEVQQSNYENEQLGGLIGNISQGISEYDMWRNGEQGGPGGQIWNRPAYPSPGNRQPAEEIPYRGGYGYGGQGGYSGGSGFGNWGTGGYP